MESRILASELRAKTLEAEVGAPEIASNAAELQERCEALATLHLEIDRLYTRWAELEEKRRSLGR